MKAIIGSKNMQLGDYFTEGWEIFKKHLETIVYFVGILTLAVSSIYYFMPNSEEVEGYSSGSVDFSSGEVWEYFAYSTILIIGVGLLTSIVHLGIIHLTKQDLDGQKVPFQEIINVGLSRWWANFVTGLIMVIMLIPLFLLFFIPGLIFAVFWTFMVQVVVLKGLSGMEALNYSKRLVSGQWWKVFWTVFMVTLGIGVISWVVNALFATLFDGFALLIFSNMLSSILEIYSIIVLTVFFLNLDTIKYQNEIDDDVIEAEVQA
jgi:hypothetical protein